MRETVTINRIIFCTFLKKEVAQQISAYAAEDAEGRHVSELITKYCSGEQLCHNSDCEFPSGVTGNCYTKPLDAVYRVFTE